MSEEKVRDFPPVEPPPLESSLYREVDIKKEGVSLIKLLLAIISIMAIML